MDANTLGPHLDLGLAFLTRDVKHLSTRQLQGRLQEQGRLAYARFTAHKGERAEHQTAAQHAVDKFSSEIIQEMSDFGIKTLKDFIELENSISKESLLFRKEGNTIPGYVRNCMILNDANKYFAKSWKMHWTEADEYLKQYLSTQGINFYALVRKKNKRGRL